MIRQFIIAEITCAIVIITSVQRELMWHKRTAQRFPLSLSECIYFLCLAAILAKCLFNIFILSIKAFHGG